MDANLEGKPLNIRGMIVPAVTAGAGPPLLTMWYHPEHNQVVSELEKVCGGRFCTKRQMYDQREAVEEQRPTSWTGMLHPEPGRGEGTFIPRHIPRYQLSVHEFNSIVTSASSCRPHRYRDSVPLTACHFRCRSPSPRCPSDSHFCLT